MNEEDEWVEDKIDQRMVSPVQKQKDPVEIIEINARPFKVTDFYIDEIINIIKKDEKGSYLHEIKTCSMKRLNLCIQISLQ